jgi:hypothetical protein
MSAGIIYTAPQAQTTHLPFDFKTAAKGEIRKLFKQPSYLPGDKLSTPLATENRLD